MTNLEKLAFEQLKDAVSKMDHAVHLILSMVDSKQIPNTLQNHYDNEVTNYEFAKRDYYKIIKAFEE
jgi:hypothetical protein